MSKDITKYIKSRSKMEAVFIVNNITISKDDIIKELNHSIINHGFNFDTDNDTIDKYSEVDVYKNRMFYSSADNCNKIVHALLLSLVDGDGVDCVYQISIHGELTGKSISILNSIREIFNKYGTEVMGDYPDIER